MAEIKCPHCGKTIQLDKSSYDALLSDIKENEIDKRVSEITKNIEDKCKAQLESDRTKFESTKQVEIEGLKRQISELTRDKELAVTNTKDKLAEELAKNKNKITELEAKLAGIEEKSELDKQLAVKEALDEAKDTLAKQNAEIVKLKGDIQNAQKDTDIALQKQKEFFEHDLEIKDLEIKKWKEHAVGDSTKDIGESLEQYCSDRFNEIRAYAYPNAYFEKDNDSDEEGKGDFIFRNFQDGIETVSIMFEMKNEKDDTEKKHKNEEFLDKLNRNRNSKKCDYAVLVTTLEKDSILYNNGIVDVSHKHPRMYVVRPQFFLAIIGLLNNMGKESFEYKKKVIEYKQQNIDVTTFETKVNEVVDKINKDYGYAEAIYAEVDSMCEDMIKKIQKFKDDFRVAAGWIEKAKNQLPNLELRKLTYGNKTMKEKFAELKASENKNDESN